MKYIFIFINALAIAIYHFVFGDPVTTTAKIPEGITPGSNFVIEVTIAKPSVTGFAKLQLELPPGFTAAEVDNKGGSFTTSGTVVKIIWTSVPTDAELIIKINVAVPASASGDKQIKGKFSYIADNIKQEAPFEPVTINLGGSDGVASTQTTTESNNNVSNNTNQATNADTAQSFSKPNEPDAAISVSRKISALNSADNFQVDVTIKKGNIKGFSKLSEKIPEGFKAESVNIAGASFAFEGGEAKFIWTSIPADEVIKIVYNLIPDGSTNIQKPTYIDGSKFSYIENGETKKIALDKQEITAGESSEGVVTNTPPDNTTTNTPPNNTTTNTPPNNNNTNIPPDNTTATTTTATTPKNGNVHYSVQIGAFQKSVNANALKRRYSIQEAVKTEMHEGYTKCILGKYDEYKTARDNRETVKSKGVTDAFVTAYNSGKRITVQEALMVSNQKWYR
jgi:cell division septation protein DedD